jgi:uncharacterized protein (TIGR00266 family)
MRYEIRGSVMQTVDVTLQAGESVYTESGGMSWMTPNIQMESGMKGGLLAALGRAASGESMFLTDYTCTEGEGMITFANEFPGAIVDLNLGAGETMICQKDAFMAAESTVSLEIHFQKRFGAGLFGGEGFILQKLTGPGVAFAEIHGEVTLYELGEGQSLRVDPGHVAMFEPTVDYNLATVKGIKNIFFSGEGLFLADLRGPGKVWLQSMPIPNLAAAMARYLPRKN